MRRKPLRALFDAWFGFAGYRRGAAMAPCDFRGILDDPLEAFERADAASGQPVVIEVPLHACRGFPILGFPLHAASPHPLVRTAREFVAAPSLREEDSSLREFYEAFQPRTGAELLGLEGPLATGPLARLPALEVEVPWRYAPGPRVKRARFRLMREEAARYGYELTGHDGITVFGPVSEGKRQLEFERITRTVASIEERGYLGGISTGHIQAISLVRDGTARYLIRAAQHRSAALAALGYERIPVLLKPSACLQRDDLDSWPAVRNGAFTREQAQAVFDRIFEGRPPAALANVWPPVQTTTATA